MNIPNIPFGEIMKLAIAALFNAVFVIVLALTMLFAYVAYTSPSTLSKVICQVNTDNYLDYANCRIERIL